MFDAILAHGDQPAYDDFVNATNPKYVFGHEVSPFYGSYTGRVEEKRNLTGKNLASEDRRVWIIKYCIETIGEGKAKNKI